MPAEIVSIVGGLISAALFFYRGVSGLLAQGQDAVGGIDTGTAVGVGGGFAALLVAASPLWERWLKHREVMKMTDLQDQLDDLRAEAATAKAERANLKWLVSVVFPVLQEDRDFMRNVHAKYPDEFPLPKDFANRDFDRRMVDLIGSGSILATTPPAQPIMEIIESSRAMPTPDPDAMKRGRRDPDRPTGPNPGA